MLALKPETRRACCGVTVMSRKGGGLAYTHAAGDVYVIVRARDYRAAGGHAPPTAGFSTVGCVLMKARALTGGIRRAWWAALRRTISSTCRATLAHEGQYLAVALEVLCCCQERTKISPRAIDQF